MDIFLMMLINWLIGTKFQHLSTRKPPNFEHIHDLSGGCGFQVKICTFE